MNETPMVLSYRLEPADLATCCRHQRRDACKARCVGWLLSLAVLLALAAVLAVVAARSGGSHAVAILMGTVAIFAVVVVVIREAIARQRCSDLAQALGLPRDVKLIISPEGITQAPDRDGAGRTFRWDEVEGVCHHGHVSVVQLRVAAATLLIPDRAFPSPEDRQTLVRDLEQRAARESRA